MTDTFDPYQLPFDEFERWLKETIRTRPLREFALETPTQQTKLARKRDDVCVLTHKPSGSKWTSSPATWRTNGWVALPDVAYGSGCYAIFADEKLVYIGMADEMNTRVRAHLSNRAKAITDALGHSVRSWVVKYRPERHYGERASLELRLIARLKPVLNRVGSGRRRGDSDLPPVNQNQYRLVRVVNE